MIKNSTGKLYVGITQDPQARLHTHNSKQGALFTKRGSNFEIVFLESHPFLKEARRREIQIKKWRRDKKEKLIEKWAGELQTK